MQFTSVLTTLALAFALGAAAAPTSPIDPATDPAINPATDPVIDPATNPVIDPATDPALDPTAPLTTLPELPVPSAVQESASEHHTDPSNTRNSPCLRFYIHSYGPYYSCRSGSVSGGGAGVGKRDVGAGCHTATVGGMDMDVCGDALERFGAEEVRKAVEVAERKQACQRFYINRTGPYYRCAA